MGVMDDTLLAPAIPPVFTRARCGFGRNSTEIRRFRLL